MRVAQHGHRSRLRARATVSLLRTDAIEFGTCRSGRIGGAAGSITCGKAKRRELGGGPSRGGNSHPFGDQEAIGCDAKRGAMVEAAPAAALEVPEPQFLRELLVVAFDAPPELGKFDQALEADVVRQRREPVFGGLLLSFRPLDQEPVLWARFAQPVVAMSGSHPHACKARGEPTGCALAPGDSVHISCARASASAFTEVGWCSPSRRISLGAVPGPTTAWAAAVRPPAPKQR